MSVKTCTLCDAKIPNKSMLCFRCYRLYKHHIHEPWFKELKSMQGKLDRLESKEISLENYLRISETEKLVTLSKTPVIKKHIYLNKDGALLSSQELDQIIVDMFIQDQEEAKLTKKPRKPNTSIVQRIKNTYNVQTNPMFVYRVLKLYKLI